MKKLFILFLGIIIFSSCSNNDIFELTSEEQVLTNHSLLNNVDISQFQNPIYLEGSFQSWVTKNNEIVIYTKTNKSNHLFIVQGNNNISKSVVNYKIDSVLYLDHSLIVSSNNEFYYFGVDKKDEKIILNQISTDIKSFSSINYGFGLIHNWSSKDVNLDIESLKKAESIVDELIKLDSTKAAASCDHGGVGSTSCSISNASGSGCSVSCSEGYYSCCTIGVITDSCVCIKNKPNE